MHKMGKAGNKIKILLAALALCGMCACSSGNEVPVVSVVEDGVLTVGIIDGGDVFARLADGEFTGIEPEILNSAAANMGVSIVYRQAADVEELALLLDQGAIDIAAGRLGRLEAYTGVYLLSRNYGKRGIYLVTEKNCYVDTLAGFSEASIGVSEDIPAFEILNIPNIGQVQQAKYSDLSKIKEDLENGVIKAAICTEREALVLLKEGLTANEMVNGPRIELVFYMPADQNQLLNSINQAINSFLDAQAVQ